MKPAPFMRQPSWQRQGFKPKKVYKTVSGGTLTPDDVALRFACSIRFHNSADKLRELAGRLVPQVCLEHQPSMKALARCKHDESVFDTALKIVNRVCDLLGIYPGERFEPFPDGGTYE